MKKLSFIVFGCSVIALGAPLGIAETNLDSHINLDKALRSADAALNEVYKEVMAAYGEPQQEALRQGQRAWINYRDACVASESSFYEGGSMQSLFSLQCAVDLTVGQTERLRALLPKAVAAKQADLPELVRLRQAREQAEAHMNKVFTEYTKDSVVPEVLKAQQAWQAFRDLWLAAEAACHSAESAEAVKEQCLATLNSDRAGRLKNLFLEGYREDGELPAATDLAFSDPPLMKAADANDLETVKRLIERGANVNEANDADYTALHVAAEKGNAEMVAALLNAGARKDLYDFDGRTAADVARSVNKPNIAHMIDQHGAKPAEQTPSQQPEPPVTAQEKDAPEPHNLEVLLEAFGNLTELRREQWNSDNQWKLVVTASGEVSEVSRVGFLSEISDATYQVTCELPGGDRAVLFLDEDKGDFVHDLEIGDAITFTGKLKKIEDWGFWSSGYIKVD